MSKNYPKNDQATRMVDMPGKIQSHRAVKRNEQVSDLPGYMLSEASMVQVSQLDASQSLTRSLNELSGALAARGDTFQCDKRTIWGDKISV